MQQAITWTHANPVHWCIYAAAGGDESICLFRPLLHISYLIIQIQIQIQNSLLLPIYSFGHTYIQFVFKYNNIHT